MIEFAYAKINRFLRLIGKRPDGYHEIRTVMQTVSLRDELIFEPEGPFIFSCTDERLNSPRNLCVKAAEAYSEASGFAPGGSLTLRKSIPFGAGLGGGSADAAAVLRLLQRASAAPLPESDLLRLARKIGADVPFCLHGGKALCEGVGERVTALPDGPEEHLLILKPAGALSTEEMYRAWDRSRPNGENQGRSDDSGNDFEPIAFDLLPAVRALRDGLLRAGALEALMSGSGSAVFGLFSTARACEEAEESLKKGRLAGDGGGEVFSAVCRTVSRY